MQTQEGLKDTLIVEQVGKFGVRVNEEWFGVNEPLTPSSFVPGKSYTVSYKRGKPSPKYPNGKGYIDEIIGEPTVLVETVVTKNTDSKKINSQQNGYQQTGYQQTDKERSQLIGGLCHDAATLVGQLTITHGYTDSQVVEAFDKVLRELLRIRETIE